MTDPADDRVARLRLIRSSQIGPVTCHQLISRFGSAQAALDILPDLAKRGGGRLPRIATQAHVEDEIAAVERLGARYLFRGQGLYPRLLNELDNAPAALIVRGDLKLLDRPSVAIVGARNASAAACRFARILAQGLGDAGILVVSGLARGIDTAAHRGSIESGTVGVIASGIDVVYPPENRDLQEDIAAGGVLIAEQPPGTEPLARHFPYRNRIIAGMTRGTVVVEAVPRSGSLITARLANEAGREVMAVPGSPLDPRAQGCNGLIRDGATLIQNAGDVIESVMPIGALRVAEPVCAFESAQAYVDAGDAERGAIVSLLSHAPVSVNELIRQAGLPSAMVQTVLLELELGGRLQRHAGAKVSLAN